MKYTIQEVEDFIAAAPSLIERIEQGLERIKQGSTREELVEGLLELEGGTKKLRAAANKAIPFLK